MICVPQCVYVGVGLCTRHNPHHTDVVMCFLTEYFIAILYCQLQYRQETARSLIGYKPMFYLWVRDCCECFVDKYTHALAAQWTRNFQYCTGRSRVQYLKFWVHCEASKCVYLSTKHERTDSNPFNIQSEYTASNCKRSLTNFKQQT